MVNRRRLSQNAKEVYGMEDFRAIVIIAEKRILPKNLNMFSNELDFSSKDVTNRIISAFESRRIPTYYYPSPKEFLDNIRLHQNDVVFSALWGGYHSRNKRTLIAAICEAYHLCYVGADAYVQALCQDKYLSKLFLKDFDFDIPEAVLISSAEDLHAVKHFPPFPCIVKPNDEGCSVGISDRSVTYGQADMIALAEELLKHYSPILIERFIPGSEISVCCAGTSSKIDILEAVQLIINQQRDLQVPWGFESKKAGRAAVTREVVTQSFPEGILSKCAKLFRSLGKVDLMRIDGKLHEGRFYIIELSPDCSLHETCFMSTAFAHKHFSYEDMLLHLAKTCWADFQRQSSQVSS